MKRFFLIFLLLTALILFCKATPSLFYKKKEGEQVFKTDYYLFYGQQLRSFCHHHPHYIAFKQNSSKNAVDLAAQIEAPLSLSFSQRRLQHETFVLSLRALLQDFSLKGKAQTNEAVFLQDLVNWLYLVADLKEATYHCFKQQLFSEAPCKKSIRKTLQQLQGEKCFVSKHLKPSDDQFLNGNLPFFLFRLPNLWQTQVIRMGYPLPTSSKFNFSGKQPLPYPEFATFLQQQPHLYVNLMRRQGKEKTASLALEQLEKIYPLLSVVTLDKNSAFYLQENSKKPMKVEVFKTLFLQQMLKKEGSYFWSSKLHKQVWDQTLKKILDLVHQRYFESNKALSQKERLNFIELTYLEILEHLADQLQVASMNITCRQCMDRGPSLYVLWMCKRGLLNQEQVKALLLCPPLLLHSRPSHRAKVNRFVQALKQVKQNSN